MIVSSRKRRIFDGDPNLEGIEYLFVLGDEDGIYGNILFEVTPWLALIHPRLSRCTKTTFAMLKKELFEIGRPLLFEKYKFDKAHFLTTNHAFVNALTDGKAKVEMEKISPGQTLYYYEAR